MGVQGVVQNRVHPQRPRQSQLAKLVVPALQKIAKDASRRKHAKLIEECQIVENWFADPSAVARHYSTIPGDQSSVNPRLPLSAPDLLSDRKGISGAHPSQSKVDGSIFNAEAHTSDKGGLSRGGGSSASNSDSSSNVSAGREEDGFARDVSTFACHGIEHGVSSDNEVRLGTDGLKTAQSSRANMIVKLETSTLTEEVPAAEEFHEQRNCSDAVDSTLSAVSVAGPRNALNGASDVSVVLFDEGSEGFSLEEADFILRPLHSACESFSPQLAETAVETFYKMLVNKHLRGVVDGSRQHEQSRVLERVLDSVCGCAGMAEESDSLELLLLKTLLSLVCATYVTVHGDAVLMTLRVCMRIATRSKTSRHQMTGKAVIAQIVAATMARMEANSVQTHLEPIVAANLVSFNERSRLEWEFVQGLVSRAVEDGREAGDNFRLAPVHTPRAILYADSSVASISTESFDSLHPSGESQDMRYMKRRLEQTGYMQSASASRVDLLADTRESTGDKTIVNDAYILLQELCGVSMKNPYNGASLDTVALREKTLALELLCFILEAAGQLLRSSKRFVDLLRQSLCVSLLENSTTRLMTVYELSCSVFLRLLNQFRVHLPHEIGGFFDIFVLRPLRSSDAEYVQKRTVLRLVESMCIEPQILVDIYANFDCEVKYENLFEGLVIALEETVKGKFVGKQLSTKQEVAVKVAAIKCLGTLLGSLNVWVVKQIDAAEGGFMVSPKPSESGSEGSDMTAGHERSLSYGENLDALAGQELSEAATFEQRKQWKKEFQECIALFNRSPGKGLASLKESRKLGTTPEAVVQFLRSQGGLNKAKIGEYLGESEGDAVVVMKTYVRSFDLAGMEIDEAIRLVLKDFRLPGEAQKVERILETFADRYFECNPRKFRSAVTAYVLSYSIIMLHTDAHNPCVKNKMTKAEFVTNNRGIDNGHDLPPALLIGLYERIVSNEIKIKEDLFQAPSRVAKMVRASAAKRMPLSREGSASRRRSRDCHNVHIAAEALQLMKDKVLAKPTSRPETLFYSPSHHMIVCAMLERAWAPILVVLTLQLDKAGADVAGPHILEGFKQAVALTSRLGMATERDAFLVALNKYNSQASKASRKAQKAVEAKVVKTKHSSVCRSSSSSSRHHSVLELRSSSLLAWCNLCAPKPT